VYTSFFGLKENPFNLTPDPRYLFLSPYHKEALDHLLYGIIERKGFIAITGGIGTGKTTLCRALLSHLNESIKDALIFNAFISDMELLKTVNEEFGIPMDPSARSKKDHIDALNHFLLETFSQGGNAVLLMDEAQNLSQAVLEQIRMLSNLETEKEKLIQIVLVGQPELKDLLTAPSLRQLDERIMVRYDLKPLDAKDIKGYVEHRLVVAGGKGNVRFTKGAFKKIYGYSRGNPRRINAVCDRALLIAYAKERYTVSGGIIGQAVQELRGASGVDRGFGRRVWRAALSATLLLFLIGAVGLTGWRFREDILGFLVGRQKPSVPGTTAGEGQPSNSVKPRMEASLFLDENMSLARLFDLFKGQVKEGEDDLSMHPLGLVSFDLGAEYYVMLKRPFRVRMPDPDPWNSSNHRYLLIRKVTDEGAVAIDAEGKERLLNRDFVLSHWGQEVSWVYPYEKKNVNLMMGMSVPDVLGLQKILNDIGYLLELTGIYDAPTFQEVLKFQRDFGLLADGIAGPRTRALLFQMSNKGR
jgi:general secretion pathway protein A